MALNAIINKQTVVMELTKDSVLQFLECMVTHLNDII